MSAAKSPPAPKSEAEAVTQYRPFVIRMALEFKSSAVPTEDLVQEGALAVAIAYRQWRPDGGANFLTWIRRPVLYAMLKVIREQNRRGGSFRGGARDGVWSKKEVAIVSLDGGEVSPDWVLDADGESLHEKVGGFEPPPDSLALRLLPGSLAKLTKRERQVIRLRYEKGLSHREVGERLKMSRELARQIEQTALKRLRELMAKGEDET